MSIDLGSFMSVLVPAITAVTALVVAVAGLLALRQPKVPRELERPQLERPQHTVYTRPVELPAAREEIALVVSVGGMRRSSQTTMTAVPRWVSSTKTPIVLIVVLLLAITGRLSYQTWESHPASIQAGKIDINIVREVNGVGEDGVFYGAGGDNVMFVGGILNGAELSWADNSSTSKAYVFAIRSSVGKTKDWIKIGEGTVAPNGTWTAECHTRDVLRTATMRPDTLSILAIVVPSSEANGIIPTMTKKSLDVYPHSEIVRVHLQPRGMRGDHGVTGGGTPAQATPIKRP